MPRQIIQLDCVSKTFRGGRNGDAVEVLKDLTLTIEAKAPGEEKTAGDFVVLLGPSGCGKSTILSLIAGLTLPDKGEIRVFDERVSGPHRYSATVPQAYTCFPWLTALKNVELGLRLQGRPKAECEEIARDYLNKVDLAEFAEAYPDQLSGGMQQRVAIARTLAMKRPIVLMDEPFGALDAQTRADMQQTLIQLWESEKNTILFVTHDITEALLLADRVLVFSPRPASILRDLIVPFGPERPPQIVHTQEFVDCAEDLRKLLQKPRQGAEPKSVPSMLPGGLSNELP
jgi:NitT/TauT family transport system ATP-binding protein